MARGQLQEDANRSESFPYLVADIHANSYFQKRLRSTGYSQVYKDTSNYLISGANSDSPIHSVLLETFAQTYHDAFFDFVHTPGYGNYFPSLHHPRQPSSDIQCSQGVYCLLLLTIIANMKIAVLVGNLCQPSFRNFVFWSRLLWRYSKRYFPQGKQWKL